MALCQLSAQNINISEGEDFDGEPFIAIDPNDAQHIVVVWMGFDGLSLIRINERVSFDGGTTWSAAYAFPHTAAFHTSADPSMAFDASGKLFLCFIDYNPLGTDGAVYVYTSLDGGLSWSDPVEVLNADADGFETPVDRPWMVVDSSGQNVFITTKPAPWIPAPNRNYFVASTDGGNTFGNWRYVDSTGYSVGDFIAAPMAAPAFSADGTFYAIYPAWKLTETILPKYAVAKTVNAGAHFEYHNLFTFTADDVVFDTLPKLGYHLAADPTDPDHLAFIFYGASFGDPDILLSQTFNAGTTWTAPIRVNDDPAGNKRYQDLAWGDFNASGDLLVSWRDRRTAADTGFIAASSIWGAILRKDSSTFSPNFNISGTDVDFDSVLLGNGNDFMGCELIGDTAYAVWGDTRDGFLNIWFCKKQVNGANGTQITQLAHEKAGSLHCFPNPADAYIQLDVHGSVLIMDASGKIVQKVKDYASGTQIDISILPKGMYFVRVVSGDVIYSGTFEKIKE
ncbi:MAG: T9SS type A sorting domain-containing protein [Chitinophagales bacterium]